MKTSSVLLAILIVFTFPIWIGILGGLFGLIFGLIGGIFGIIGGVFGAVFGAIGSVFAGIFGWGDYEWHGHWGHHHGMNGFWVLIAIIAIAFALRSRSRANR